MSTPYHAKSVASTRDSINMEAKMPEPWNEEVRGNQVLPLINRDAPIIRVEAGPGTGKTFGLTRRVERIVHPDGLGMSGNDVLVVAFNRVIAKDLQAAIDKRLEGGKHLGKPVIRTVHALCLQVIGRTLRLLLPHEREAMLYDVLTSILCCANNTMIMQTPTKLYAITKPNIRNILPCGKPFKDGSSDTRLS